MPLGLGLGLGQIITLVAVMAAVVAMVATAAMVVAGSALHRPKQGPACSAAARLARQGTPRVPPERTQP